MEQKIDFVRQSTFWVLLALLVSWFFSNLVASVAHDGSGRVEPKTTTFSSHGDSVFGGACPEDSTVSWMKIKLDVFIVVRFVVVIIVSLFFDVSFSTVPYWGILSLVTPSLR